jgi:hypothetical protein
MIQVIREASLEKRFKELEIHQMCRTSNSDRSALVPVMICAAFDLVPADFENLSAHDKEVSEVDEFK